MAIPYTSDYSYGVDLGKCSQTLYNYDDSICTSNNWLTNIVGWFLTHNFDGSDLAWNLYSGGFADNANPVSDSYEIAPVLFIDASLTIKSGVGLSSDPYQLDVS